MQQPNKNKIIHKVQIILLSLCLTFATSSYCQKVLRIPFIQRDIQLNENSIYYTFKAKQRLFLLTTDIKDSTLLCFIFKKNRLKMFGRLSIVQENNTLLALRHGYWRIYLSDEKYERKYYYRDELMENESDLPAESINEEKYLYKN